MILLSARILTEQSGSTVTFKKVDTKDMSIKKYLFIAKGIISRVRGQPP